MYDGNGANIKIGRTGDYDVDPTDKVSSSEGDEISSSGNFDDDAARKRKIQRQKRKRKIEDRDSTLAQLKRWLTVRLMLICISIYINTYIDV